MKKEFEREQKDNQIEDAFSDMPDMDDDEKFRQWLEEEYIKEADAIEESLFAGRRYEDNQDIAEKLSVSSESFYQRAREEGLLDEATEAETVSENSEKKVLAFRKSVENAGQCENTSAIRKDAEDVSTEKIGPMEEKTSRKKKHSYVRFGKIAGIAGVCLICVFAASMSSEANRNYFVEKMRYLVGDDTRLVIDNDENNDQINLNEYDAIENIEKQLNVQVPEIYYRPQGMEFFNYEINTKAMYARMDFKYENNIVVLYIDKQNEKTTSYGSGVSGDGKNVCSIEGNDFNVTIKQLVDAKDEKTTYIASWIFGETTYSWIGKIELDELKKIIKELKF